LQDRSCLGLKLLAPPASLSRKEDRGHTDHYESEQSEAKAEQVQPGRV